MKMDYKTLNNFCKKLTHGRSMLEMLAVLAIIGILSIGGFLGYRVAMTYYMANETVHDVMLRGTQVPMAFSDWDSSKWAGQEYTLKELGVTNKVGYTVHTKGNEADQAGYVYNVEVQQVPARVCRRILSMEPPNIDEIRVGDRVYSRSSNSEALFTEGSPVVITPDVNEVCGSEEYVSMQFHFFRRCEGSSDCGDCETCVDGYCKKIDECLCHAPAGGCGECQDWDYASCSCQPRHCCGAERPSCGQCEKLDTPSCTCVEKFDRDHCESCEDAVYDSVGCLVGCHPELSCEECYTPVRNSMGCVTNCVPQQCCGINVVQEGCGCGASITQKDRFGNDCIVGCTPPDRNCTDKCQTFDENSCRCVDNPGNPCCGKTEASCGDCEVRARDSDGCWTLCEPKYSPANCGVCEQETTDTKGCVKGCAPKYDIKTCGDCEDPVTDVNGCVTSCTPKYTSVACGLCEKETKDANGCVNGCAPRDDIVTCGDCEDPVTDGNGCVTSCKPKYQDVTCGPCEEETTDENGCKNGCKPKTGTKTCGVCEDEVRDTNECVVNCTPKYQDVTCGPCEEETTDNNGCKNGCKTRSDVVTCDECEDPVTDSKGCAVGCTPRYSGANDVCGPCEEDDMDGNCKKGCKPKSNVKTCGVCEEAVQDENGCVVECNAKTVTCGLCETTQTDANGCVTGCAPMVTCGECQEFDMEHCTCITDPCCHVTVKECTGCQTEVKDGNGCVVACSDPDTTCGGDACKRWDSYDCKCVDVDNKCCNAAETAEDCGNCEKYDPDQCKCVEDTTNPCCHLGNVKCEKCQEEIKNSNGCVTGCQYPVCGECMTIDKENCACIIDQCCHVAVQTCTGCQIEIKDANGCVTGCSEPPVCDVCTEDPIIENGCVVGCLHKGTIVVCAPCENETTDANGCVIGCTPKYTPVTCGPCEEDDLDANGCKKGCKTRSDIVTCSDCENETTDANGCVIGCTPKYTPVTCGPCEEDDFDANGCKKGCKTRSDVVTCSDCENETTDANGCVIGCTPKYPPANCGVCQQETTDANGCVIGCTPKYPPANCGVCQQETTDANGCVNGCEAKYSPVSCALCERETTDSNGCVNGCEPDPEKPNVCGTSCYGEGQVCCENIVRTGNACCGNKGYSTSSQKCCPDGTLVGKDDECGCTAAMAFHDRDCCYEHGGVWCLQPYPTCHNTREYPSEYDHCCYEVPYRMGNGKDKCCQNDEKTEGHVADTTAGEACCYVNVYNTNTEGCCVGPTILSNGMVVQPTYRVYNKSTSKCCSDGSVVAKDACCPDCTCAEQNGTYYHNVTYTYHGEVIADGYDCCKVTLGNNPTRVAVGPSVSYQSVNYELGACCEPLKRYCSESGEWDVIDNGDGTYSCYNGQELIEATPSFMLSKWHDYIRDDEGNYIDIYSVNGACCYGTAFDRYGDGVMNDCCGYSTGYYDYGMGSQSLTGVPTQVLGAPEGFTQKICCPSGQTAYFGNNCYYNCYGAAYCCNGEIYSTGGTTSWSKDSMWFENESGQTYTAPYYNCCEGKAYDKYVFDQAASLLEYPNSCCSGYDYMGPESSQDQTEPTPIIGSDDEEIKTRCCKEGETAYLKHYTNYSSSYSPECCAAGSTVYRPSSELKDRECCVSDATKLLFSGLLGQACCEPTKTFCPSEMEMGGYLNEQGLCEKYDYDSGETTYESPVTRSSELMYYKSYSSYDNQEHWFGGCCYGDAYDIYNRGIDDGCCGMSEGGENYYMGYDRSSATKTPTAVIGAPSGYIQNMCCNEDEDAYISRNCGWYSCSPTTKCCRDGGVYLTNEYTNWTDYNGNEHNSDDDKARVYECCPATGSDPNCYDMMMGESCGEVPYNVVSVHGVPEDSDYSPEYCCAEGSQAYITSWGSYDCCTGELFDTGDTSPAGGIQYACCPKDSLNKNAVYKTGDTGSAGRAKYACCYYMGSYGERNAVVPVVAGAKAEGEQYCCPMAPKTPNGLLEPTNAYRTLNDGTVNNGPYCCAGVVSEHSHYSWPGCCPYFYEYENLEHYDEEIGYQYYYHFNYWAYVHPGSSSYGNGQICCQVGTEAYFLGYSYGYPIMSCCTSAEPVYNDEYDNQGHPTGNKVLSYYRDCKNTLNGTEYNKENQKYCNEITERDGDTHTICCEGGEPEQTAGGSYTCSSPCNASTCVALIEDEGD